MSLLVLVVTLWGVMFIHELGHLIALSQCGVRVRHFFIGLPVKGLSFSYTSEKLKRRFGDDSKFTIGLIPLVGGVAPEDDKFDARLSYRDSAYISGMGPLFNFFGIAVPMFLLSLYAIFDGIKMRMGVGGHSLQLSGTSLMIGSALLLLGAVLVWKFRKQVCAYILPFVGLYTAYMIGGFFLFGPGVETVMKSGNFVFAADMASGVRSVLQFYAFWLLFNYALGLLNLLPFYPLDGGRIFGKMIPERWEFVKFAYGRIGMVLVLALIILSFGSDLFILFQKLF